MKGSSTSRASAPRILWRHWCVLTVACFGALGLTFFSAGALASTPDLASVVLTHTLPGLVENPPGPINGPITSSNFDVFSGGLLSGSAGDSTAAVRQQLADGDVSGYVRTWSRHAPENGDSAVIVAFSLADSTQVVSLLGGINEGMSPASTAVYNVPDVAGATGYVQHQPLSAQPGTEYAVTFARGNIVFEVEVATITGRYTVNDAEYLASLQAAKAPGAVQVPPSPTATAPPSVAPSSPASGVSGTSTNQGGFNAFGLVAIGVSIAILTLFLIRRRGRRSTKIVFPAAAANGALLASDEDRDRVAEELREHYEAGRLTLEEFNKRVESTLRARTGGDLYEIMKDLPQPNLGWADTRHL